LFSSPGKVPDPFLQSPLLHRGAYRRSVLARFGSVEASVTLALSVITVPAGAVTLTVSRTARSEIGKRLASGNVRIVSNTDISTQVPETSGLPVIRPVHHFGCADIIGTNPECRLVTL
jgi:hypothetical protein